MSRPTLRGALESDRHRVGMVSTYPPFVCGLATFAAALSAALERRGHTVDVVRLQDGTDLSPMGPSVLGEITHGDHASIIRGADLLSQCDVVIVQHEYGIFGGNDGCEVLDLVDAIAAPVISVLHTVPSSPTPGQRSILAALCARSDRVVVMSSMAQQRLTASYPVDPHRVVVIPHGATTPLAAIGGSASATSDVIDVSPAPQLLTWGLLGPGKGIEHVIDALALLGDTGVRPRYTVAGVTHPKVYARIGDQYRHALIRRCWASGVAGNVTFDDSYRDLASLTSFVASASVVILPYDSPDQATSGVLVDALAAGRPVIATAFPHAVELLSGGAGILVPHADPAALAGAIRSVLEEPDRMASMEAAARSMASSLSWSNVARLYAVEVGQVFQEYGAIAV